MTNLAEPLGIPDAILLAVYREARTTFPSECCGWLTGPANGKSVDAIRPAANDQNSGAHPTAAERSSETAYVFNSTDLLALNGSLDSDVPARIIYHSHPNGRAYLSDTDRSVATSPWGDGPAYPVQQLVVGIDGDRVVESALFDWSDEAGEFVELARYAGAEI
jgi:proteasome lid subunit RPN8/RPN11